MSSVDRRGITNACQDDPCHLQLRVTRLEIANAPAGPASIGRPASRTVAGDGGESTETSAATDNKGAAFSQRAGAGPLTTFSLERSLSAGYEVEAAGGGVPDRRGARHKYGILLSPKNADRDWVLFWYRTLPWIVLRAHVLRRSLCGMAAVSAETGVHAGPKPTIGMDRIWSPGVGMIWRHTHGTAHRRNASERGRKAESPVKLGFLNYRRWDSNPHRFLHLPDFESGASAISPLRRLICYQSRPSSRCFSGTSPADTLREMCEAYRPNLSSQAVHSGNHQVPEVTRGKSALHSLILESFDFSNVSVRELLTTTHAVFRAFRDFGCYNLGLKTIDLGRSGAYCSGSQCLCSESQRVFPQAGIRPI